MNHNCIKNTALTLFGNSKPTTRRSYRNSLPKSSYSRQDIYKDIKVDKTLILLNLGQKMPISSWVPLLVGNDPFELSTEAFDGLLRGEEQKIINDYKNHKITKKQMAKYENN